MTITRERALLWGGGVFLVILLLVEWVVTPMIDALDNKQLRVDALAVQSQELNQLTAGGSIVRLRSEGAAAESDSKVTALLPWLERNVTRAGLSSGLDQIAPKSPQGSAYRELAVVRFKEVNLTALLPLLERIEKEAALHIVRAKLRRRDQQGVDFEAEVGLR